MPTILMTNPCSFAVNYSINPWMDGNTGLINKHLALQQWSNLRNILSRQLEANVYVLPIPPTDCPDAVFTANAGLVYQNKFIPSRFRHHERQAEEPYFISWFKQHELDVFDGGPSTEDRSTTSFEGAGDALFGVDKLWFGHGFRSTLNYAEVLEAELGVEVKRLKLVDPRWYHLDTCFCPLDDGRLFWYPAAFDAESQATIREVYDDITSIEVTEADALRFACNAISVGNHLVTPHISGELADQLYQANLEVIQVDMSEFLKSGGACKCLSLRM